MQTLTITDVVIAGRAAYEAGTLTAQSDRPYCTYLDRSTGCKCVVGSALNDETMERIEYLEAMGSRIILLTTTDSESTSRESVVYVPTDDQVGEIVSLQNLHDDWCRAKNPRRKNDPLFNEKIEEAELRFTQKLFSFSI